MYIDVYRIGFLAFGGQFWGRCHCHICHNVHRHHWAWMVKAITENSHSAPGQECPSSDDRGWLVSGPANIREGPSWANDRRSYNSCVQAIRLTGTDYQMLRDGFGKRIGIGKAWVFKMWFQMVPTRFTCTKSVSIKGYQRSLMFLVRSLHESTIFYNHFNKRKSATLWCPEAQFTHCCFRPAPMRHRITIKFHSIKVSQLYLCGSVFQLYNTQIHGNCRKAFNTAYICLGIACGILETDRWSLEKNSSLRLQLLLLKFLSNKTRTHTSF